MLLRTQPYMHLLVKYTKLYIFIFFIIIGCGRIENRKIRLNSNYLLGDYSKSIIPYLNDGKISYDKSVYEHLLK
jgi:hypothetical protein